MSLRTRVDDLIHAEPLHASTTGIIPPESFHKPDGYLTALVPAQQIQTHLFDRHDRDRSQKLMAVIDTINAEWGSGTIRYVAVGLRPGWLMRCARRSPRYTTRWNELVVVQCED